MKVGLIQRGGSLTTVEDPHDDICSAGLQYQMEFL